MTRPARRASCPPSMFRATRWWTPTAPATSSTAPMCIPPWPGRSCHGATISCSRARPPPTPFSTWATRRACPPSRTSRARRNSTPNGGWRRERPPRLPRTSSLRLSGRRLLLVVLHVRELDRLPAVLLVLEVEGVCGHEDRGLVEVARHRGHVAVDEAVEFRPVGRRDPAADREARRLVVDRQAVFALETLLEHVELQRTDNADDGAGP